MNNKISGKNIGNKAEIRLANDESMDVLPLAVDEAGGVSTIKEKVGDEDLTESQGKKVALFENDVLVDRVGHGREDELRKSFRSKDLSEADLSKPEIMPSLEEQWIQEESSKPDVNWVKRGTLGGALLAIVAGTWAFSNLGEEEVGKEERAQELREIVKLTAQSNVEYSQDMAKVAESVKLYIQSTSIEERAKYCRDSEGTLRKMTEHYDNELMFDSYHFESVVDSSEIRLAGRLVTVTSISVSSLSGEVGIVSEPISLLLEKQKDGTYLVDWETAVAYQPADWDAFVAKRDTEPHVFRVEARERIDYGPYLYEFSNDSKFQAYRVGNGEKFLIAYAKKDSDIDIKMKSLVLKKGSTNRKSKIKAPMILKIAFPENAQSDQCVEIIEVVSDSWFLP